MGTLRDSMSHYDREHTHPWNKLLHAIGIPAIFISLVLLVLADWRAGLPLFALGWGILLVGHQIEGNNPAFFRGPIYFLVGPLWVAKEIKDLLLGRPESSAARNR